MIYILGFNSFIAKHLYYYLKKQDSNIIILSHDEINLLKDIKNEDILINCCGINRADNFKEYNDGNFLFLKQLCSYLSSTPYLIHFSSSMITGFKNIQIDQLSDYQKWFIDSKINGENFLLKNYNNNKLCIIRPSNVYGYDCKPYYNNLLTTLVYDKINNITKPQKINKNCFRNMISIESLSLKVCEIIKNKKSGIINIFSNNTLSLEEIINNLYNNVCPSHIEITDDSFSIPNNENISGDIIVIPENIIEKIKLLETDIIAYYKLVLNVKKEIRKNLEQSRGNMLEITDLNSKRLYKITVSENSIRGNHYHYEQIEDFYINFGKILFLLAYFDNPNVIYKFIAHKDEIIRINPGIIHTVINDFKNNLNEIIISSTQQFVVNKIPDTKYINLI